jgi:hypothetical protein
LLFNIAGDDKSNKKKEERKGRPIFFYLVTTASSLTHSNLLNLLFCVVLNFTPQDDTKIRLSRQGRSNGSLDSDGTANGTDGNLLDFDGTADGGNVEGPLDFVGTKDGLDDGLPDSDGITKASWTARWTRMVQLMTCLTLMAQRMALTTAHLTQRSLLLHSTNVNSL